MIPNNYIWNLTSKKDGSQARGSMCRDNGLEFPEIKKTYT